MNEKLDLTTEIVDALATLSREDRELIQVEKAVQVTETVFEIRERQKKRLGRTDEKESIRNGLAERHVGAVGQKTRRQKVFAAYWRLLLAIDRKRRSSTVTHVDFRKRRIA